MPATGSFAQYTGSSGNSTTPAGSGLTATSSSNSMSWDFETADNTGTTTYTANPVNAGSASYPVWLKPYFTNGVAFTVSNFKIWMFNPAASSANTASFTVYGTTQTAYSIATGTATGTSYASNVAVPTSANSTSSPGSPLTGLGTFGTTAGNSGTTQNFVSFQLSAAANAPAGTTGYFGFSFSYDEN